MKCFEQISNETIMGLKLDSGLNKNQKDELWDILEEVKNGETEIDAAYNIILEIIIESKL